MLDDATFSVDTQTERIIQESFTRVLNGRTAPAIAHHLSTVVNSDRIVVIHNGRLVEDETHERSSRSGKTNPALSIGV
jgi:ABC-type multidrug transport system fused ATPase/permease subunit